MTQERNVKPRSRGLINASGLQLLPRHVERIKTLRVLLEQSARKAEMFAAEGDVVRAQAHRDRLVSLQEELDRRLGEVEKLKAELASTEA